MQSRESLKAALAIFLAATLLCTARAEPPLYATPDASRQPFSWPDAIRKNVPPLTHDRGDRRPMILWEPGPQQTPGPAFYKDLLARGFTQHIHLDAAMIPIAQALQAAGSPVIIMEGKGGTWPDSLAGAPETWSHLFDKSYTPQSTAHGCPAISKGWAVAASEVRATLQKFADAGVTVNAVWMDWEGDPAASGSDAWQQALHCERCRATLPPGALADERSFNDYCWRRYMDLVGAHLAAPVAEIFPACSVTNWHATVSTPQRPVRNWLDRPYPPVVPPLITASNPVAYGNTVSFRLWKPEFKLDREHVDQFYTHLLLSEVSDDTANRLAWTPGRGSIPWVCRWCPDDPNSDIPIMTRPRYREVLRHLWLRGISGMQVFNPVRPGFEQMAIAEVQDAAAAYDEMLPYKDLLDHGVPLCLDVPKFQDDGAVWSGVRNGGSAVIRIFKQGKGRASVTVEPWPGKKIALEATPEGRTYSLFLKDGKIRIGQ